MPVNWLATQVCGALDRSVGLATYYHRHHAASPPSWEGFSCPGHTCIALIDPSKFALTLTHFDGARGAKSSDGIALNTRKLHLLRYGVLKKDEASLTALMNRPVG